VQLFDVTSISQEKQRRWKVLLAMLCYRFAMRIFQSGSFIGKDKRAQLQAR
jgi:hypothetical protein